MFVLKSKYDQAIAEKNSAIEFLKEESEFAHEGWSQCSDKIEESNNLVKQKNLEISELKDSLNSIRRDDRARNSRSEMRIHEADKKSEFLKEKNVQISSENKSLKRKISERDLKLMRDEFKVGQKFSLDGCEAIISGIRIKQKGLAKVEVDYWKEGKSGSRYFYYEDLEYLRALVSEGKTKKSR